MKVYDSFVVLCISSLICVGAEKLTEKEAKLLRNNCGRYVEGYHGIEQTEQVDSGDEFKVLYGKEADEQQAPWSVSILRDNGEKFIFHASGTLVSPYHVITAAHVIGLTTNPKPDCETGELKNAKFVRHSEDLEIHLNTTCAADKYCESNEGVVVRKVKSLYVRKGYVGDGCLDKESFQDISVIELAEPVRFNRDIYPACIVKADTKPQGTVRLYGYGSDPSAKGQVTGILKFQDAKVTECVNNFNSSGIFCASPENQGLSCDGDSGAGYVQKPHGRNSFELVGVLSGGVACENVIHQHKSEDRRNVSRSQEYDLVVDVSLHTEFFCSCCGLC